MSESQLMALCETDMPRFNIFWTAEVYGFGKQLRKYGFYPQVLPLCVFTDHGPHLIDEVLPLELENHAPCMLVHSQSFADKFRSQSEKPCFVMGSPFVFFRRRNKIEKSPDAKGTLIFPAHSTDLVKSVMDVDAYIEQLLRLPPHFQPLTACIYFADVQQGLHKKFESRGIDVVTVGHAFRPDFIERFYSILRNFSYTTSNSLGSYLFYSVEMDIPFFLLGDHVEYVNNGDGNIPLGSRSDILNANLQYQEAVNLFEIRRERIAVDQKEYVAQGLGLGVAISRFEMTKILYTSFFKFVASKICRSVSSRVSSC